MSDSSDAPLTLDDLRGRATITVQELHEVVGLGVNQCREAVKRGDLPGIQIGRRWLVPVPALLKALGADPPNSDDPALSREAVSVNSQAEGDHHHE